jgi:uncharacterized membrane protein
MADLIVLAFKDEQGGFKALEEADKLQKQELLALADAAVVVKDQKGKVKVKQTLEKQATGTAAVWGGFWGLLIGLLFLAPIFWGLAGALLGALMGRSTDLGIDNKFIKEVGNSLEPGNSALFMLVVQATEGKVAEHFAALDATVFQTNLSAEDEEKLKKLLEHDNMKDAAQDTLELEDETA